MQTQVITSKEEYFDILQNSDTKLEFHNGEIVAMAGAKPAHNLIVTNITTSLLNCLRKKGCFLFSSDQLIKIEECDKYLFPDLVIVCKNPVFENTKRGIEALENPEIIIEVLSDTTEAFDRTEKFDCYKTIPSFREYVLVSSNKKKVEVIKKINDSEWLIHTYSSFNEKVMIDECEILFEDIYYQTERLSK